MGRLCSNESSFESKLGSHLMNYDSIDAMNRVMDFYAMSALLQPRHNYFIDKQARIIDWLWYKEPEHKKMLGYVKLGGEKGKRMPRENPYRRHQLAKHNTARKIRMMKSMVEKFKLEDFMLAYLTLTMPEQLSIWLSNQDKGADMAWTLFQKFWKWYNERFGDGLAAHVNLHTWKTQNPLEPHFHFHCLIPNYMQKKSEIIDDEECETFELVKQPWHKQRGGKDVPVSEAEILEIKVAWGMILEKFARKKDIQWTKMRGTLGYKKLNIYIKYAAWREIDKIQLMHWFNYDGRYPLEDYTKYSNKHLDCDNPLGWLTGYENHNRAYGWWKIMKKIAPVRKEDKTKLNPVTGNEMEYMGRLSLYEVMELGPIGFLEVIKGKAVFHRLSGAELNWLISVQRDLHPGKVRAMMYDNQVGENEMEEN